MSLYDYKLISSKIRWLYIDFNSYFASVEQQLQPRLRGRPIAVVPVDSDSTSVIAASYEAKAFGIKTGTPVYEARRLCPEIICVLGRHENYVTFHNRILIEIDRHIPVTKVCSIDEVACLLMDNENSLERAAEIARAIKTGLARNIGPYVRCSIGFAPNRYLAKVATDLQKPDGMTFLGAQNLPQRLLDLPLSDLPGIGRSMERRLSAAGVDTTRILLGLDASELRRVWGNIWGERIWYLLRGVDLPEEEIVRRSLGHSHVLAPELRVPLRAKDVIRRLTLKVTSRLRRMGFYASAFSLSVRIEHGPRLSAERRCPYAQDSLIFLDMMSEAWHQILNEASRNGDHSPQMSMFSMAREPLRIRFKKVSVTLYNLRPADQIQPELFDALPHTGKKSRDKAVKLSLAVDKINQKYGRDSVLIGMLPSQGKGFTGTKIAFTRIPDIKEFAE